MQSFIFSTFSESICKRISKQKNYSMKEGQSREKGMITSRNSSNTPHIFFSLHFSNKLIWSKTYVEDVQRATFSEHQQLRTRQAKACEAPTCSTEAAAPSSKGLQKKLKAFCQSCSPSQAWQNSLHPPRASKCTALQCPPEGTGAGGVGRYSSWAAMKSSILWAAELRQSTGLNSNSGGITWSKDFIYSSVVHLLFAVTDCNISWSLQSHTNVKRRVFH